MAKKASKPRAKKAAAPAQAPPVHSPPPSVAGLEPGTASAPVARTWDMRGVFMSFALNCLEGRKGVGKSSVCAAVAAHFAGGPPLPGEDSPRPSPILWHCPEESWESEILPRLILAGADPAWCFRLQLRTAEGRLRRLSLPSMLPELTDLCGSARVRLLVLDPLGSATDPGIDLRFDQPIRAYLEPLAEMCSRVGATALLSRHLRKGVGGDARDSGLGGGGIGNCCRTVNRLDEHPTIDRLFVMSTVANNWAPRNQALLYRLVPVCAGVRVEWSGTSELSADMMAEGSGGASNRDAMKDAQAIVRELLADGPRPSVSAIEEGKQCGIAPGTLRAAKVSLRCKSHRRSDGPGGAPCWYWHPPVDGWPEV